MSDILAILGFSAGLVCLVGGAWLVVHGGTRIARYLGIAPVVIGLTVVAFGTSAPELFVALVAALRGNGGLMFGNVVGSNVANIGLILGLTTLVAPVAIESNLIRREIPLLVGVTMLFAALSLDRFLSRLDGLLLVVLFGFFMWLTLRAARREVAEAEGVVAPIIATPAADWLPGQYREIATARSGEHDADAAGAPTTRGEDWHKVLLQVLVVAAGIAGLTLGGRLIIESAIVLAERLGASETLIGLSLVAVGTSLPELATTLVAAKQGHSDLALGNIVGSNLFNILAVAGPVITISPVEVVGGAGTPQVVSMLIMTVLLVLAVGKRSRISRAWGGVLLISYGLSVVVWLRSGI